MKIQESTKKHGHYTFSCADIQLPDHDADIVLVFPNGKAMSIQVRCEGPSVDICLPEELEVYNWKGHDMQPADTCFEPHIHKAEQLMICIPQEYVGEEEDE